MTWFRPAPAPPPAMTTQLGQLRAAFPAYEFQLINTRGKWRFDVWRADGSPGLYALISTDPRELWQELAQHGRAPPRRPC